MLLTAHIGHNLWILYVIPLVVVLGSVLLQLWRNRGS
jgi:hypothetical protein